MTPKRLGQLTLLAGALAVFYFLSRAWPRAQTLRFDLGAAASRVEEVRVAYDPAHGAEYHFAPGTAPRVVETEVHLADGDYVVEIDVAAHGAHASTTRRVHVESSSTTTVDLSRQIPE